MKRKKKYVLDSNIFMEAANRYYAFDLVPCFWGILVRLGKQKKILSIHQVKEELLEGEDLLSEWSTTEFEPYFVPANKSNVLSSYSIIVDWVQRHPDFQMKAKLEFVSAADSWIIAYAMATNSIVVSHEAYRHDIKKRVPIPNVCEQFGIEYVDTFEMLRRLKVTLA